MKNSQLFKILLFLSLLGFLSGCDSLNTKVEELSKKETVEHKVQNTDKGNNSYSGDPTDEVHVVASGNTGPITINLAPKQKVEKNEKRDTSTEEELDTEFSFDYHIAQISPTGWALLVLALCALAIVMWWWTKTTATGKAFDKFTADRIETVNRKLAMAEPGSTYHQELQSELADLQKQQRVRK